MASAPTAQTMPPPPFFGGQRTDRDPAVHAGIAADLGQRLDQLELITSENIRATAVLEAQRSIFTKESAENYRG